jgi:hypothetical protein
MHDGLGPDEEPAEDGDAESTIELGAERREPAGRASGGSMPRWYLVLAAAGLLVVGFAAGVLAQRARTPKPPRPPPRTWESRKRGSASPHRSTPAAATPSSGATTRRAW